MVKRGPEDELDLVNVPEEKTLWLNIYKDSVHVHGTREGADKWSAPGRIARVKVTYKEGQFDE